MWSEKGCFGLHGRRGQFPESVDICMIIKQRWIESSALELTLPLVFHVVAPDRVPKPYPVNEVGYLPSNPIF